MQLKKRNIKAVFILDPSLAFTGGENAKEINDLSISCEILEEGMPSNASAKIIIDNMIQDDIDYLTTLNFKPKQILKNRVIVYAGYDGALTEVFSGDIIKGSAFYGANRQYVCEAVKNFYDSKKVLDALQVTGTTRLSALIQQLAAELKYKVTNKLKKEYVIKDCVLEGSALDRLNYLAKITNINLIINNEGILLKEYATTIDNTLIQMDKDSGMIGYPTLDENGITFTCFYSPDIRTGSQVRVESVIKHATGIWQIYSIKTELQNYGDKFIQTVKASYVSN